MISSVIHSTIPQLLASLGIVLPATSRAFLPPLLASLYFRALGLYGAGTQHAAITDIARAEAPWFVSDAAVVILAILALAELVVTKSPDLEAMVRELDPLVKPAMAALTTLGILGAQDATIIAQMLDAEAASSAGALGAQFILSGATAAFVFVGTQMRAEALQLVDEVESDTLSSLVGWMEEFWVLAAMLFLLTLPLAMLVLSALLLLLSGVLERSLAQREARLRSECSACGHAGLPHAPRCAGCGVERASVAGVGWFGGPSRRPAGPDHGLALLAKGRCPTCACRLPRTRRGVPCSECGTVSLASEADAAELDGHVHRRLPFVLGVCFLLSAIPVVGALPAIFVYRARLVAPYRRYLPRWKGAQQRWLARVASLLLLSVQIVPVVGSVSVPLMALVNHAIYRRAFLKGIAGAAAGESAARTRRPRLARLAAIAGSRPARYGMVGAFVLGVVVVVGFALTPGAAAAVDCATDEQRVVGGWEGEPLDFGWVEIGELHETYGPDGVYLLNGARGAWRDLGAGRFALEVGEVVHDYDVWVTDDAMYYRSPGGVISRYARSAGDDRGPACTGVAAGLVGEWVRGDERIHFTADGRWAAAGDAGGWRTMGATARLSGGACAGAEAAVNEGGLLLLSDDAGEPLGVFRRVP